MAEQTEKGLRAGKKFDSPKGITKEEVLKLLPALKKLAEYDKQKA